MTLHTDDFSHYRRYGATVTTVGDLTPKDLVELQNEGFVRIYVAPWRWAPMYGKHGVFGFVLLFVRILRMMLWRSSRLFQSLFSAPIPAAAAAKRKPNSAIRERRKAHISKFPTGPVGRKSFFQAFFCSNPMVSLTI